MEQYWSSERIVTRSSALLNAKYCPRVAAVSDTKHYAAVHVPRPLTADGPPQGGGSLSSTAVQWSSDVIHSLTNTERRPSKCSWLAWFRPAIPKGRHPQGPLSLSEPEANNRIIGRMKNTLHRAVSLRQHGFLVQPTKQQINLY